MKEDYFVGENMYKITLYDRNCCPICDGTTFWFVDNLEEFEKNWLPLQCKYGVSTIERYYRSKFGEIVTDYYSDSPELNIVQQVDCEILQEKELTYTNKEVVIKNTYGWETKILFDKLEVKLRVQRCGAEYYLVGQYCGYGGVRVEKGYNRWYDKEINYHQMYFFGNPVANYIKRDINWDDWGKGDAFKDFFTNDKSFYKHESVKTFVWLPIKEVDKDFRIKRLTKGDLGILLADIVGEAG